MEIPFNVPSNESSSNVGGVLARIVMIFKFELPKANLPIDFKVEGKVTEVKVKTPAKAKSEISRTVLGREYVSAAFDIGKHIKVFLFLSNKIPF
jgi:hypothetical protein